MADRDSLTYEQKLNLWLEELQALAANPQWQRLHEHMKKSELNHLLYLTVPGGSDADLRWHAAQMSCLRELNGWFDKELETTVSELNRIRETRNE